jgi:hypothetical protein
MCVALFIGILHEGCNTHAKQASENLLDPDRCDRIQFGTPISLLAIFDAISTSALC